MLRSTSVQMLLPQNSGTLSPNPRQCPGADIMAARVGASSAGSVRQTPIKLSACFVTAAAAAQIWLLVPASLVFMGHGAPSAVVGGSVAHTD